MPYSDIKKTVVKGKEKWCFHNKETKERHCSDSYEKAVTHQRLMYHLEGGGKLTKKE